MARSEYSFVKFYKARCVRLLPALLFMLTTTYIACSFLYLPEDFKSVGQFVVSTAVFSTNLLLYFKQSDYFGLETSDNPLFHTWSLGVEWQFYVIFPLIIYFLVRHRWGTYGLISFIILSIFITILFYQNISAVFYLPIFRFWEIAIGVLLGISKIRLKGKYVFLLGVIILVVPFSVDLSLFYFDVNVLVAVVATSLVIFSSAESYGKSLLLISPMQHLGRISYSLYLWHIPIYILMGLFVEEGVRVLLTITFLYPISLFSHAFFESKRYQRVIFPVFFSKVGAISFALIITGCIGHVNGGFPNRSEFFGQFAANNGFGLNCNGNSKIDSRCISDIDPLIAVLGNSYAMVYVEPLAAAGLPIVQLTMDSCAVGFIDNVKDINSSQSCSGFYKDAVETINRNPSIKTVIVSSTFEKEMQSEEFRQSFLELISKINIKHIIVVGPTPRAPFDIGRCFLRKKILLQDKICNFELSQSHINLADSVRMTLLSNEVKNFVDVNNYICENGECIMDTYNGGAVYVDTGHLSQAGAFELIKN